MRNRIWIDWSKYKQKYRCRIRKDKGNIHIGYFDNCDVAYKTALEYLKQKEV